MLERFMKPSEAPPPPPPPPPSWAQMEADLRAAAPTDVVFSDLAARAKHEDDEDADCSGEAIAVFKQSRELFLANRSLEKSCQTLREHQESLEESARDLTDLVEEVRQQARDALRHATTTAAAR